jgi:DNA-directed RNA polymerase sigma subunit (sigma70/sigma32)
MPHESEAYYREREMQVLRWWREGCTQREIGQRLTVSAARAHQILHSALERHSRDDGEWGDYARRILSHKQVSS